MRRILSAIVVVGRIFLMPAAAQAAFPGANGKIAYVDGNGSDIVAVNPDGSGATTVAPNKFFGEPGEIRGTAKSRVHQ